MAVVERTMTVCDLCSTDRKARSRFKVTVEKSGLNGEDATTASHELDLCGPCGVRLESFVVRGVSTKYAGGKATSVEA